MESTQIEELLQRIQKLQSIMINVATREVEIQDVEEAYIALYQEVDLDIELLQEEDLSVSNPNSFTSLWDWCNYWSSNLSTYTLRRKYIYDSYIDVIDALERTLQCQSVQNTTDSLNNVLDPEKLEKLLFDIQKLQSIMINVAIGSTSIQAEENLYIEFYREVSAYMHKLQILGFLNKNPNNFSSLWHWHSYWKSELEDDRDSRRQFVIELYTNVVTPIQKALRKHQQRLTSTEKFIEDLQRRFSDQVSEQHPTEKAILSPSVRQDITAIKANVLPAGSSKAMEPDSQGMNLNSVPLKIFISYSHDSQEHKDRVWKLADHLRMDGIDCTIDQHEESPTEGWHRWMLNQIEAASIVLVACTEQYNRRFQGREEVGRGKGVTWEGGVIIQVLYDAQGQNSKFIPIIFIPEDANFIPNLFHGTTNYDLSTADGYDLLYRRLTSQPKIVKSELGKLRILPPHDRKQGSPEVSSSKLINDSVVNEEFEVADRLELADLLKRSGRAVSTSRRSLCQALGLNPGDLSFVSSTYSDKDFAIEFVNHLFETGHDLTKLCDQIKPDLHGQYAQKLQNIYNKIQS